MSTYFPKATAIFEDDLPTEPGFAPTMPSGIPISIDAIWLDDSDVISDDPPSEFDWELFV